VENLWKTCGKSPFACARACAYANVRACAGVCAYRVRACVCAYAIYGRVRARVFFARVRGFFSRARACRREEILETMWGK